ncbi:HPF/RaiA family ribosome-associated protein [Cryobacterium sinapicolor]|uniref:HPF/RaiA family ribosome-associated protein n=1 Tax=Cryobacterium sinapicolor TaxID=1259236 RepID=A0ABY2IYD5_9MICO|nr:MULTISPECIES: HPF/RaiA family ribosome-associated protein [Cryobacterium]TFC90243.1 HPF/RaiA family ribosome-associated protein [Cryobacterium sp. TMT3-29-2]TFC95590.1 HPF/RaiA family ribosome-associated protein [Cryobacterium sinapicolor]
MQILVNTDNNIAGTDTVAQEVEATVETALARFSSRLTRVEVHLRDESAGRATTDDIRCLLEVRPAGGNPLAATDHASTVAGAVGGALHKLARVLESAFGRMDEHKGASSMGDEQTP